MAEGFVLNIPQEMLNRLEQADEKIEKIATTSEGAMRRVKEAFADGAKSVEGLITQLNTLQKDFSGKPIKLGVELDKNAIENIKKQIASITGNVNVGANVTGGGGTSTQIKELIDRIIIVSTYIDTLNKQLVNIKITGGSSGGCSKGDGKNQVANSQNAKTVNERIQAIKLLQKEMFNLDTTDKNYQNTLNKLNAELTRQQNVLKQLGVEVGKIKLPKVEIPKPDFAPLRQEYQNNQAELKRLQTEYDNVVKKIKDAEVQIANIQSGKGGSYNPKEYQENLGKAFNLEQEMKLYQDENKLIADKMRLLNQEYQAKVKLQQANDPKNIALIEKEKKEYEDLLKTIRQLENEKKKAGTMVVNSPRGSSQEKLAQSVYTQTTNELNKLYQRRIQLEQKYGAELSNIQRANNVKELEELRKQEDEKIKIQEQSKSKAISRYKSLVAEQNRLKTEQYNTQKIANNPQTDDATRQIALDNLNKIKALLRKNKQEMLAIERKYQSDLANIQEQAGQQELRRVMRQNQQEAREIERERQRQLQEQRNTPQGALQYQQEAKTIQQKIQAINHLKRAQQGLDISTRDGRKAFNQLETAIRQGETELRRYGVQMNNVREKSNNLFNITGQLGRALSLMFSVSQITQYVRKMVDVRKEMELQQKSLQVLLQDRDKANELWNQTIDLAVKSPFRVKELITYTKQLAAYRIESDKLHDTTKRLADVSAGLGVDMQRLILAFGQVKAASFLRGTELRQFTEAGIPMLEQLAEYFGEIQGRAVSVAEVFDMISKRMVTFTDVENVFKRMTNAGGVFFNMQEEQSKTLAGMLSNLQDSIDLMFNEMGKKNQGIINDVIKAARYLVDNWETVGKVMKGALLTLLMYKTATMDISEITKGLGANVEAAFSLLKENPLEFFQAFKGNIITTALTAIIDLVIKVVGEHNKYKRAIEEVNKAHEKFRKSVSDVEDGFADLFSQGVGDLEEYKGKLQELVGIAQQSYNIEMDFQINNLETIEEVSRKFDELKAKILSFDELSLQFDLDFVDANDRGWEWFEDYLGKDLTQLGESQKTISKAFYDIRTNMTGVLKDYYEYQRLMQSNNNLNEEEVERLEELSRRLRNANTDIIESFKAQNYDEETSYDFFQRNVEGLREWIKEYNRLLNQYLITYHQSDLDNLNNFSAGFTRADVTDLKKLLENYDDKIKEATIELDKFYQKTEDDIRLKVSDLNTTDVTVIEKELSNMVYNSLKKVATEKEYNELILNEMLSQAEKYYKNNLGYELDLMPKIKPVDEKDLEQWKKDLKAKLEKNKSLLQGSIPMVTFQTTHEKALKDAETAWKETEDLIKRIENARSQTDNDLISAYANYDVDTLKKKMEVEMDIWRELGGTEDAKGKNKAEERIKEQIRLIKNLYEQYQKLSKAMGGIEAKQFITKDFAKLLNDVGLNISEIDFTNIAGIVSYLEILRGEAQKAGEDASFALEKAISETAVELTIMAHVQKTKDFENEINDMFSDYEIGIELKKLDIPQDWAKDFFGIDNVSLTDIQNKLNERLSTIEQSELEITEIIKNTTDDTQRQSLEIQKQGYKDERVLISEQERKIRELIEKEQYERLKTYIGYARKSISERARLKLDEVNKLIEIEETFNKELAKINSSDLDEAEKTRRKNIVTSTKNAAIDAVKLETSQNLDKWEWEEFQKTDTFINLFKDLENASEEMLESTLKKLNEFKNQWSDMPLEDMKQVIEKINELEMALANLSPRDTIKKSKENLNKYIEENDIKGDYSDAIAKLQEENLGFETQNLELEKVISNLEVYFRLLEEGKQGQADEFYNKYLSEQKPIQGVDEDGNQVNVNLSEQNSLNREQLKLLRNKVQANKDNINDNQKLLSDAEKLKNAYLKQAENIGKVQQVVGQLKNGFDSVVEAAAALGADTEDIELFGNMANDIISSTLGMVQLQLQLNAAEVAATGFGAAMNTALGVIGWIVLAIQIIAKVISSIAKSKDNKLVKEIEEQQRKIENLQKAYEDLDEKIDEAWSVQQLQEYHRELKSTTEDLITAQKAAIAAQEQRKKSSKVGSDEWKELQDMYAALDEFEKQLEDTEKEIFSKITGGIMDDILGVTESFVDAWYDAFKETGDGLKGLEDNFNEILLNLVKRQAVMKVAGRFIDQWNSVLERYVNNDDNLSLGEITSWANMIEQDLPALSSQLETFFKAFDGILGDTQGNLSGLQRGISSITESQADILASYLNSIRFIVSDSNAQLKLLVSAQTGATTRSENPMVEQLRVIAQQTSAINTLLNSLTAPHPTQSGRGLKVVI